MRSSVHMRKRRTGHWCSTGQGSGGFTSPTIKDDASDDAGDDDGDDLAPEDQLRKVQNEAKKRRLQVRDLRKENADLKAQLAKAGGDGATDNSRARENLVLGLVEAGLSRSRIRMAIKLVDPSTVTDVDDAIDELREEYPDLFEPAEQQQTSELPGQGSRHNGSRSKGGPPSNQDLINRYPALRRDAHGRA